MDAFYKDCYSRIFTLPFAISLIQIEKFKVKMKRY